MTLGTKRFDLARSGSKKCSTFARFSYFKEDGSIREAVGTLNPDRIPEDKRPKGTRKGKVNYATFPYYDLDRCAWRSFDIRNFIGFVEQMA